MNKILYSNSDYINYLFYGIDLISSFSPYEMYSIYKNKYKKLSYKIPSNIQSINNINFAKLLFDKLIDILNNNNLPYSKIKIDYIKNLFNEKKYDRLIYNKYIPVTFYESYIENDDEWNSTKEKILSFMYHFPCIEFVDDSYDNYRLLTMNIFTNIDCYNENIYDLESYSIDVISAYLKLFNSDYDYLKTFESDNITKQAFKSELKYFIKTGHIFDNGLFTDFLNNLDNIDYTNPLKSIKDKLIFLISIISEDNLDYVLILQNYIFRIYVKYLHKYLNNEDINTNRIFSYIIALDIFIYNKSRTSNILDVTDLYRTYNEIIISLSDDIEKIDISCKKRNIYLIYKSQLMKTREKLKERVISNVRI